MIVRPLAARRSPLAVAVAVAAAAGCGSGAHGSAPPAPVERSHSGFDDDVGAGLATDGRNVWLAVVGHRGKRRKGRAQLEVYRVLGPDRWRSEPAPPRRVDDGPPMSLTAQRDAPCVAYTAARRPYVACLRDGRWAQAALGATVTRGDTLLQVASIRGELHALVARPLRGQRVSLRVLRHAAGRWSRLGRPFRSTSSIASFGQPSDTPHPDIAVLEQGERRPARRVLTLEGNRWVEVQPALTGRGVGPSVSGSVRSHGSVFLAVNEANASPWRFSVYAAPAGGHWRRAGAGLNQGVGNAQGRVDLVAGEPWAIWQEHRPRQSSGFEGAVYAVRMAADASGPATRPALLWRGVSIGPGALQLIAYGDAALALYTTPSPDGGLRATLAQIPRQP